MKNHLLYFAPQIRFLLSGNIMLLLSFLFCILTVLIFTNDIFAQIGKWQYVATLGRNTIKVYLNDETSLLANKNVTVWQKLIVADGSSTISQEEFDCKNKRRITRQITYYRPDQTTIETKKKSFEWEEIIPSSTADFIYRRVCLLAQPVKWAKISVSQANLRNFPDNYAPILRIAKRGEKFQIVPETGKDGWFNVVDIETQEDYWLQNNAFEITESSNAKQKSVKKENSQPTLIIQKQKAKAKRSKNKKN